MKGSSLVETVVATIIIMASFMMLMTMASIVGRRASGYAHYREMCSCRDSVVTAMARGGMPPDGDLIRRWGTLRVEMHDGAAEVMVTLASGQSFTTWYLFSYDEEEGK